MNEYVLSVNKFKKPKVVTGAEAIYYLIVRLILLEPGTIQSHPEMGVGIVSRYRFDFSDRVRDLESDIEEQIQKYLPDLVPVNVSVTVEDMAYNISIEVDGRLYNLSYDSTDGELENIRTT